MYVLLCWDVGYETQYSSAVSLVPWMYTLLHTYGDTYYYYMMYVLTPHLQYVLTVTPLLLCTGVCTGNALLSTVTGCYSALVAYGALVLVILLLSTVLWMKDNTGDDLRGMVLHVAGVSLLCAIVLVVVAEAALFSSLLWAVIALHLRTSHLRRYKAVLREYLDLGVPEG